MTDLAERAQRMATKARLRDGPARDYRDRSDPESLRDDPRELYVRQSGLAICPRCEKSATELVPAWWEGTSRPGYCGACSDWWEDHFDTVGWPPWPDTLPGAGSGSPRVGEPAPSPGTHLGSNPHLKPATALRRQRRRFARRSRVFLPVAPVAELLDRAPEADVIYTVGPRAGGGTVAGLREWATADLPAGWSHAEGGHWLKGVAPVARYVDHYDREVQIHRAASWFGEAATDTFRCAEAWTQMASAVAVRFDEGALLTTPGGTGRYLLLRSIPFGREWPVLSDDDQTLIRSTSGQGRIELLERGAEWPAFSRHDGRFAYAAVCWGLGSGPATHDSRPDYDEQRRGRYRVRFTVPKEWDHVGILPVKGSGGGWEWPNQPGEVGESWCDGAEMLVASRWGWPFSIEERLLLDYDGSGPLDGWARRLVEARNGVGGLARVGMRAILLHGIGALHGRGRRVMRVAAGAEDVPSDADDWHTEGEAHVWTVDTGQAWPAMSHPEWSAAIWGRQRARLLDGPGGGGARVGALHLPPGDVLAFRTDAIYARTGAIDWPDDQKEGRYRLTGEWAATVAPVNQTALLDLTGGD